MTDHDLTEAKRLAQQAQSHTGDTCSGLVDLALAINLLIGLMEGHRHYIDTDFRITGPPQAMEGR